MSSLGLVDFTVDEVLELASAEEALQTKSNEENTALSDKKHRNDEAIVDLLQVTLDQPAANDVLHSHDETQLKISDMSPHQVSLDAIFPPPESEESEDKPKRTIDYGDAAPQVSKKERIDTSCFTEIPALPDDPWMTTCRRNKQESALCRLPNELTGMIISHLSEESKYILQQSSRRFYGVYSGPGFSHPAPGSGCSAPGSLSSPSLMTASSSMSGVPPQTAVGTSCVDHFFDSVPIHRNRNLTRRYYPGPTVDETGMFRSVPSWTGGRSVRFSYHTRVTRHDPRKELQTLLRKDIYCPPCQEVIRMEDLTSWRDYHKTRLRRPLYCSGCARNHPLILFSIHQRSKCDNERLCIGREGYIRLCVHKTIAWSDVENFVAGRTGSDTSTFTCEHESHRLELLPNQLLPLHTRPSFNMSYSPWARKVNLKLNWSVSPLDLKAEDPTTVTHIRDHVRTGQLAATVALCPHESFDDISFLLRPFDPHHCVCTQPQAQSAFPTIHTKVNDCMVGIESGDTSCCRCDSNERGGFGEGKLLAEGRPIAVSHRFCCDSCATLYTWNSWNSTVYLTRSTCRWRSVKSPYEYIWISLLDPASYDIKEPAMCHTLWCETPECATARQWKQQKFLGSITEMLRVEGQWGEPTPEERASYSKRSVFDSKDKQNNSCAAM